MLLVAFALTALPSGALGSRPPPLGSRDSRAAAGPALQPELFRSTQPGPGQLPVAHRVPLVLPSVEQAGSGGIAGPSIGRSSEAAGALTGSGGAGAVPQPELSHEAGLLDLAASTASAATEAAPSGAASAGAPSGVGDEEKDRRNSTERSSSALVDVETLGGNKGKVTIRLYDENGGFQGSGDIATENNTGRTTFILRRQIPDVSATFANVQEKCWSIWHPQSAGAFDSFACFNFNSGERIPSFWETNGDAQLVCLARDRVQEPKPRLYIGDLDTGAVQMVYKDLLFQALDHGPRRHIFKTALSQIFSTTSEPSLFRKIISQLWEKTTFEEFAKVVICQEAGESMTLGKRYSNSDFLYVSMDNRRNQNELEGEDFKTYFGRWIRTDGTETLDRHKTLLQNGLEVGHGILRRRGAKIFKYADISFQIDGSVIPNNGKNGDLADSYRSFVSLPATSPSNYSLLSIYYNGSVTTLDIPEVPKDQAVDVFERKMKRLIEERRAATQTASDGEPPRNFSTLTAHSPLPSDLKVVCWRNGQAKPQSECLPGKGELSVSEWPIHWFVRASNGGGDMYVVEKTG